MAQIVNKTGSTEQWSADVLAAGQFAARLSVSMRAGVQTVRLRRMLHGATTGEIVAEWTSKQGRPWGTDAIDTMVSDALSSKDHGRG